MIILTQLGQLMHMFPMGIGIVTGALVGRSIGAGKIREGRIKGVVSVTCGFLSQCTFVLIMFLFAHQIPRLYTRDEHTLEIIDSCWYIFMIVRLFGGLVGAYQGIITGLGL